MTLPHFVTKIPLDDTQLSMTIDGYEPYENWVTLIWGVKHNFIEDSRQFRHKMT